MWIIREGQSLWWVNKGCACNLLIHVKYVQYTPYATRYHNTLIAYNVQIQYSMLKHIDLVLSYNRLAYFGALALGFEKTMKEYERTW